MAHVTGERRCTFVKRRNGVQCHQPKSEDGGDFCNYHSRMLDERTRWWRLAVDLPDAAPEEALAEELKRASVVVKSLELLVLDADLEDLLEFEHNEARDGGPGGSYRLRRLENAERALLSTYRAERRHLTQTADMMIRAGVADRQVRILEQYADAISDAMLGFAEALGLDPRASDVRRAAAAQLRLIADRRELTR